MHDDAYIGGRSKTLNVSSCMTISGERTEQLDIFCCVTGFTSDFMSFIDVDCGTYLFLSRSPSIVKLGHVIYATTYGRICAPRLKTA